LDERCKENAGIFNHTQGWGVIAECLLGHGDRAYAYYRAAIPAAYNDRAEIRQIEPYVPGPKDVLGLLPTSGDHTDPAWLTGAAAWAYFSATQYILGLRPEIDGLRIDPCIPSAWDGFTATRRFRGKTIWASALGMCRKAVTDRTARTESLTSSLSTFVGLIVLASRCG